MTGRGSDPRFANFLNGPYGVGKSTVLDHLADRFAGHGVPFSLFDVDWFHRSWPPAEDDPDNVLTEARNIAAVWANYRRTGPHVPLVAGVVTSERDRRLYGEHSAADVADIVWGHVARDLDGLATQIG